MKNILISLNAFKESFSSKEGCLSLQNGFINSGYPAKNLKKVPLGDGGDGTLEALSEILNFKFEKVKVKNPLGKEIEAICGIFDKIGYVEMAYASGLKLLKENERNPLEASSYGTGQLIKYLLDKGVKEVYLGVGGSATVDGGMGALSALGVKFLDKDGNELEPKGKNLNKIKDIDISGVDKKLLTGEVRIKVLVDVKNPLIGEEGAARVYGPQKGATPEMVEILEKGLENLREVVKRKFGVDINIEGGGAAGGISAGFYGILKAEIKWGIETFLNMVNFEKYLNWADIVITGEGKLDKQTKYGKAPYLVAKKAKEKNKMVIFIAGEVEDKEVVNEKYYDFVLTLNRKVLGKKLDYLKNGKENLFWTGFWLGKFLKNAFE
ncbi:glycerate kinase [Candidatus Pacearchaeota archaeon]|nr:MAG: glycerate kinase [Candidatus Pacearchaeota archaeon]